MIAVSLTNIENMFSFEYDDRNKKYEAETGIICVFITWISSYEYTKEIHFFYKMLTDSFVNLILRIKTNENIMSTNYYCQCCWINANREITYIFSLFKTEVVSKIEFMVHPIFSSTF